MQNRCVLVLSAALIWCSAAQAGAPTAPNAPAALSPALLGEIDGILSYCIKIDPNDAPKFEALRRSLISGDRAGVNRIDDDRDHDPSRSGQGLKKRPELMGDRDAGHPNPFDTARKDPAYQASFQLIQNTFNGMSAGAALLLCRGGV